MEIPNSVRYFQRLNEMVKELAKEFESEKKGEKMPRLNDEDRLKHAVYEYVDKYGNIEMSIVDFNIMLERNRADAKPVRHGHWEEFVCSVCGEIGWDNEDNYCPNCGAKMDGERKDK